MSSIAGLGVVHTFTHLERFVLDVSVLVQALPAQSLDLWSCRKLANRFRNAVVSGLSFSRFGSRVTASVLRNFRIGSKRFSNRS